VHVPTLMLHGELDGASLPASSEGKESFFTGPYERQVLPGVGHFPPRERPGQVSDLILSFLAKNA
jgi:pimeloyl-ACP methyl ester carboxylesterase